MNPESRLPLKELELHVLLGLSEAVLHGYALMLKVQAQSKGVLRVGPASLYRTIASLYDEGLIEEAEGPGDSDDPRRRYFRNTKFGQAVLRAELRRWSQLLSHARALGVRWGASES